MSSAQCRHAVRDSINDGTAMLAAAQHAVPGHPPKPPCSSRYRAMHMYAPAQVQPALGQQHLELTRRLQRRRRRCTAPPCWQPRRARRPATAVPPAAWPAGPACPARGAVAGRLQRGQGRGQPRRLARPLCAGNSNGRHATAQRPISADGPAAWPAGPGPRGRSEAPKQRVCSGARAGWH
jgi:hypothetical protein